ncbi:hypothetical protein RvY_03597 [Ramazzottius varieornatus]|uniref:Uncharacterized protein n=1 Tax=Ramazzottius varieornatus TaxID=947166 RepID=A0A1D1US00_RAMVA|nr:hypothetical protein RvY_03597 [Ramazzottius varieornatus]
MDIKITEKSLPAKNQQFGPVSGNLEVPRQANTTQKATKCGEIQTDQYGKNVAFQSPHGTCMWERGCQEPPVVLYGLVRWRASEDVQYVCDITTSSTVLPEKQHGTQYRMQRTEVANKTVHPRTVPQAEYVKHEGSSAPPARCVLPQRIDGAAK